MAYHKDKIRDVIAVLTIIKTDFDKAINYCDVTELRKLAVKEVAETELLARRYIDKDSAEKTIHDACARRLGPDVGNIIEFEGLVKQWLRKNSTQLRDILLRHSGYQSQRRDVEDFFGGKFQMRIRENRNVILRKSHAIQFK